MRKDWPVNNQNLPELALIEGIQQVAMKRDESFSPSLFTFRSHFTRRSPLLVLRIMTAARSTRAGTRSLR